jgi:hypothetical protein
MSEQEKVFDIRAAFVESVFGSGVRSADSFAVSCPSCCATPDRQHKKKLSVRLDTGMHHCWICGLKGKTLFYTVKKYRPNRLSEYARIFEDDDYQNKINNIEDEENIVKLPNGFIPIATSSVRDPDFNAVITYLKSRGIGINDFYKWRFGTCLSGGFSRRVIMPSFDSDGDLNYYTARSIDNDGHKKYINSKVKRKDIIFNELNIRWNEPLTLVEGPFDLVKCNWNATAMLGSYLDESYQLFQAIVQNKTDVVLAMDSDARTKFHKIAEKLKSYGINVKYLNLGKFNDVGEMSKTQFNEALLTAKSWSSTSMLSAKISQIRSGAIF